MAGFELTRQMGYSNEFISICYAIALVMATVSALHNKAAERPFTIFVLISVIAYGLAGLVMMTEGTLAEYLRLDLYRYLLALGNLFSASAIFIMIKKAARGL